MKIIFLLAAFWVNVLMADTPSTAVNEGNEGYKQREIMYSVDELFEGLKKTLMQSKMNIVTVTKENGVITARGDQYNKDTITEITVSISFKPVTPTTSSVGMIASYNVMEKKANTGQVGFAGISLPIPVPLTGRYAMIGSGHINDSAWYQGFYNSLDKILFEEKMKSL
ncbi:MAG: hypothetical protein CJD30_08040 [Sulfuricurvum sp. PD_MW2]|jgi:hypothetical protein|uniref:hypothetical protein n=1 Tax=Sulfuricurvum sp. PD_MW2 TaxID=2027917 RepID=UPI000C062C8D|nr:hypothetical protein [Sulfuricurvum sp. PD_MW2]PHM17133.1 MAG: hypothetical protein CJD30_08040 [Sulfuricurvum sp. PD_MW2]